MGCRTAQENSASCHDFSHILDYVFSVDEVADVDEMKGREMRRTRRGVAPRLVFLNGQMPRISQKN